MDFKRFTRYSTIAALLATSFSVHAQLQLSCSMDWSALTDIDSAKPDQLIAGLRAGDWTKAQIDQMLGKEEDCAQSGSDPESIRKARLISIQTQGYPNALKNIDARDQRLLREKAALIPAEKEAQQQAEVNALTAQAMQVSPRHQPSQPQSMSAQPPQQNDQVQGADPASKQNLWIALAGIGGGIGIWLWNKFIRNRCPNCKTTSFDRTRETELDRWRGTKEVSERNSRGIKTRHVQATFVHLQFDYRCKHCQHEWMKVRKEELGGASKLTRFFAGF